MLAQAGGRSRPTLTRDVSSHRTRSAGPGDGLRWLGRGVFKSTDAGRSWEKRNLGLFPHETADGHSLAEGAISAIVVNSRRPQTLYVGYPRGVFQSTDGARTWRPMNVGLVGGHSVASLAIDPSNPQTLYTGTYLSGGIFKTTNGGRRWAATGPPGKRYVLALALDPTDSETIYVGMAAGAKAFKSVDRGRTWRALSIPIS